MNKIIDKTTLKVGQKLFHKNHGDMFYTEQCMWMEAHEVSMENELFVWSKKTDIIQVSLGNVFIKSS